jgi:hypothetical protein
MSRRERVAFNRALLPRRLADLAIKSLNVRRDMRAMMALLVATT